MTLQVHITIYRQVRIRKMQPTESKARSVDGGYAAENKQSGFHPQFLRLIYFRDREYPFRRLQTRSSYRFSHVHSSVIFSMILKFITQ
jgi:hypothetical protein